MIPRPDERAAQEYEERDRRFRGNVKGALGSVVSMGAAVGIGSKILPFINEYVPTDLALKGISKVAPQVGNFLRKGQSMGLDLQEGLQYVKDKFTPQESPKQNRNIVEQYSPELHEFILSQIKEGRSPTEAGALAALDRTGKKSFRGIIDKITRDHSAPWQAILETVYGQDQMAQPNQQQQDQIQQQQGAQGGVDPQLAQIMGGIRASMQKMMGQ